MNSFLTIFPIIFILLFIYLGQAFWIYLDGKHRQNSNGWLWAVLALANFPVPLIIYLIITRYGTKKCNSCGRYIDKTLNNCPYCGDRSGNLCNSCGYTLEEGWNFCPNCNNDLKLNI
jgi:RNA polymerase subunit RPABC4/transcription elongation factor Spt4